MQLEIINKIIFTLLLSLKMWVSFATLMCGYVITVKAFGRYAF